MMDINAIPNKPIYFFIINLASIPYKITIINGIFACSLLSNLLKMLKSGSEFMFSKSQMDNSLLDLVGAGIFYDTCNICNLLSVIRIYSDLCTYACYLYYVIMGNTRSDRISRCLSEPILTPEVRGFMYTCLIRKAARRRCTRLPLANIRLFWHALKMGTCCMPSMKRGIVRPAYPLLRSTAMYCPSWTPFQRLEVRLAMLPSVNVIRLR